MGKGGWFGLTAAAVVVTAAGAVGIGLAALGIIGVSYYVSCRVHPRTRHTGWGSCHGTGESRGGLFNWSFRKCPDCQGGRKVRWGAGQFGSAPVRSEYQRGLAARKKAKAEHRWR